MTDDSKRELAKLADAGEKLREREREQAELVLAKSQPMVAPQPAKPALSEEEKRLRVALVSTFPRRDLLASAGLVGAPFLVGLGLLLRGGWPQVDLLLVTGLPVIPLVLASFWLVDGLHRLDRRRSEAWLRALPYAMDVDGYLHDLGQKRERSVLVVKVELEEQVSERDKPLFEAAMASLGTGWTTSWEERGAVLVVQSPQLETSSRNRAGRLEFDNAPVHAAFMRFATRCLRAIHRVRPIIKLGARIESR